MKKVLFAFTCLCGLCGCLNMNDDSTIDESSIVITRGKIRDVYVEAYVDVEAKGLKGIDVVLPNKGTGYNRIHEMGYTMIYEVYDSQGNFMNKFPTYAQANNYKYACGNSKWTIKQTKF